MKKVYDLSKIKSLKNRSIFFDTNILIYLFWPTNKSFEKQYSKIFSELLKQKNNLFVDFIVISEIVNRTIRIEYVNYIREYGISKNDLKFKEFRDSETGKNILEDIFTIVNAKILKSFNIATKEFTKNDIKNFLEVNLLDFSDKGIESICKDNNYILLTNDSDFINSEIEVLTINKKLLK